MVAGRHLQCAWEKNYCPHKPLVDRNYKHERNNSGTRGRVEAYEEVDDEDDELENAELERLIIDWAQAEFILRPLKDLRGLERARIEGTVTENWAVYLETCMTAKEGANMPDFIGREVPGQLESN